MKMFYMGILLLFQIILLISNNKNVDNELRNVVTLIIGETGIAICIIGALG